ncbi:MAG: hydrogenase maturation protease [Candidatus Marinimicrobia bacterium]|nr:hydrogenase maturation protease [Candidatus Neomarinimicrobiota bacterium]MCF7850568.1 hydrogenase maturation protease [Candidatus Neomarinimicrobiota bacterium]MCF7903698.1 hydrogenase maturation protease [Candidatus Neomarinimicrobiota bacterium]
MKPLTVIGIGNRLRGDDAAGPMVIDGLMELNDPQVELIDAGSDAIGLLEYLNDRNRVWIVDACSMAKSPGEVVKFRPDQVDMLLKNDLQNLHGLGLAEALKMATELKMLPKELMIFGIQPQALEFNSAVSSSVLTAIERLVHEIHNEIQEVGDNS